MVNLKKENNGILIVHKDFLNVGGINLIGEEQIDKIVRSYFKVNRELSTDNCFIDNGVVYIPVLFENSWQMEVYSFEYRKNQYKIHEAIPVTRIDYSDKIIGSLPGYSRSTMLQVDYIIKDNQCKSNPIIAPWIAFLEEQGKTFLDILCQ